MNRYLLTTALYFYSFLTPLPMLAQSGRLELTYGENGYNVLNIGPHDMAHDMVAFPDGSALVAAISGSRYILFKCDNTGNIDQSFPILRQGKIPYGYPTTKLCLQNDGKILVANLLDSSLAVYRYGPNGAADYNFGNNGITTFAGTAAASAIAQQPDGKIIVAYELGKMIRLNMDGSIDNTWGTNGIVTMPGDDRAYINSILNTTDGKIIVMGQNGYIVKLNERGAQDTYFGKSGSAFTEIPEHTMEMLNATLQADGKILAGGYISQGKNFEHNVAVLRYNSDGTPDISFGQKGIATYPLRRRNNKIYSLAVQPDGKILAGGKSLVGISYTEMFLMRFLPNGDPDAFFGSNLGYTTLRINTKQDDFCSIRLQGDGKILATGSTLLPEKQKRIVVARFTNDIATKTNTLKISEPFIYPNPANEQLNVAGYAISNAMYKIHDAAGKVVAAGLLTGHTIDLSSITPGSYTLDIKTPKQTIRY